MKDLFDGLVSDKKYMKLKDGENRFRIVTDPISGWVDWKDKKPYRYRLDDKPKASFDVAFPMKPFLACYVWDYEKKDLFILELTQVSILKALRSLCESEDWGEFTAYDIKIKREGAGQQVKYVVEPVPPKPMAPGISDALQSAPVRLEALYEGKDPWLDLEAPEGQQKASVAPEAPPKAISAAQLEQLNKLIGTDLGLLANIEREYKIDSIENLPTTKFDDTVRRINEYNKRKVEKINNTAKERIA